MIVVVFANCNYLQKTATEATEIKSFGNKQNGTLLTSFSYSIFTEKPLQGGYQVFLEVNQTWDWNEYWTNNKYPDDFDYTTA